MLHKQCISAFRKHFTISPYFLLNIVFIINNNSFINAVSYSIITPKVGDRAVAVE